MTSDAVLTFIASVLGSGLIAARIAARAQRKAQFREGMIAVASDFAAGTMKVLAALRRYKPTKPGARRHRNEPLISDHGLRTKRYDEVQAAADELRGLRGRVRLHFPGRGDERSSVTVKGDDILGALRDASDACEKFWARCDADPKKRRQLEERFEARYQDARHRAWEYLNAFCNQAAESASRPEQDATLATRLWDRVARRRRDDSVATRSGAEPPRPQSAPSNPGGPRPKVPDR
jgi:hypothetical protein